MSDDKKLPPTQKKLRDARKRGEIPHSPEVVQTGALAGLIAFGWMAGSYSLDTVVRLFALLDEIRPAQLKGEGLIWFITEALTRSVGLMLTLLVLPIFLGVFVGFMQSGWLVAMEPLSPKFERLNPATNLKNMFQLTKVYDILRRLFKSVLLALVIWQVGKDLFAGMIHAPGHPVATVVGEIAFALLKLLSFGALIFLLGAVGDYVLKRLEFMKQQRMSHDDVKRERKDQDGDPHVQGQRRALRREMATSGGAGNTKKARVVVTNPTHVAVALRYGDDGSVVPMVCAKGVDQQARRIREEARHAGIPLYEDVALARKLYACVELDEAIGRDLFEPVARVLAWVEELEAARDGAPPSATAPAAAPARPAATPARVGFTRG